MNPSLSLGRVVATPGAIERMKQHGIDATSLLRRHVAGDWGDLDDEDWRANDQAVKDGNRVLSSYGRDERCIWIITEADRSVTTLLRPEDY